MLNPYESPRSLPAVSPAGRAGRTVAVWLAGLAIPVGVGLILLGVVMQSAAWMAVGTLLELVAGVYGLIRQASDVGGGGSGPR